MSTIHELAKLRRFHASVLRAQASVALLSDDCFCSDTDDDDSEFYLPPVKVKKTDRIVGAASEERLALLEFQYAERLAEFGLTLADMASENPSKDVRQRIARLNADGETILPVGDYRPKAQTILPYVPRTMSNHHVNSDLRSMRIAGLPE